jgi:hypothetical protein
LIAFPGLVSRGGDVGVKVDADKVFEQQMIDQADEPAQDDPMRGMRESPAKP